MTGELTFISGVSVHTLQRVTDERGIVLRMLRSDAPGFSGFGEIYFSVVYPRYVKGWRRHTQLTSNLAVPVGAVRLVLFDGRSTSPSFGEIRESLLTADNYCRVTVPPGVWTAFAPIVDKEALVANVLNAPYDSSEVERRPSDDAEIGYVWAFE